MKIKKLFYVVLFSWILGIFNIASAGELCTECLSKVPKDMRDYVYNMDFMIQNGVINQSFIKGTFLGDDIAYCNEIRSAIEITISESKK